jgi:hypothetical protein
MSCESDVCRQDIPYPIVSQESVASILGNLTSALYGTITKTVVDGRVVWSTCDVNQQATVFGIPRNAGEGLMCYFLRAFQDSRVIAVPAATSASQVLVSQQAGSQTLVWRGYASEASPNTIVSRDSQGSSQFYDVGLSGNLYVSGTITCENTLYVSPLGIGFANGTIQTVAGITSLTGDVTATPASNGSASATVARIRGINVSATVPVNGQVLKYNGTQWAPSADTDAGITALTGDVIASGSGSVVATLANTGVVAASYGSASSVPAFSVDAKGRITSASNQTITPAAIGAMPVFSTLGIALGGTGATTQQAALNALAGAVTSGQYLRGTGANVVLSAIQAGDVPTLNQNTTGTASNVTGVVAVANGGTGATTLTGIIKGNGTGAFTAAVAGTDYLAAGTAVLKTGDTMSGALTVSTTGTGTSLTVSNAATATSDCVVITNQGTGRSLIVNDVSGDATPFVIDASGRVGIGVATSTFALDVCNRTGQTTDGVVRFSIDNSGTRTTVLNIFNNGLIEAYTTFISGGLLVVGSQGIFFNQDASTQTKAGITSLSGDVTASAGDATASVVRIQGRSVASTAPTSGQVLAWNGTAWTPTTTSGGTVTSITAGSGLSGGTITGSGTISANFGTSAGTITQGGTTVLKTGDTMSGALTISTNGTSSSLTVSNATTATSDCVVITNQGTGKSLIVNDVAGDITPFIIHAAGEVAIGTTDNPAAVLSIKQTTLPTIRILSGAGASGDLIKYQHNTTTQRDFTVTAGSDITCYSVLANGGIQSNLELAIVDGITIGPTDINFSSLSQANAGVISKGYYETTSSQATVTINAGTQKTYSITVTNAALQDFALASLSVSAGNTDATALQITAHVHTANTVIVVIRNSTASNVTLTTPTIKVRVWKS